ncbi:MAG: TetR family transcriptional regulator [Verrucomicrobia bacterium]|nr:TetR family transcriptional regulator [Verrucomicrobiota bacterium]
MKMDAPDLDPRIRRTRQLLYGAFRELLAEKNFEEITVQDIAERSTVNRATFYDHFPDKFALLEEMVSDDFQAMLRVRMAGSNGTCPESIKRLIDTVCDFFAELGSHCQEHQRQFAPLSESKIQTLVRNFLLKGLIISAGNSSPEDLALRATVASGAICGAALEWSRTKKPNAEDFAEAVFSLIAFTLKLGSTVEV